MDNHRRHRLPRHIGDDLGRWSDRRDEADRGRDRDHRADRRRGDDVRAGVRGYDDGNVERGAGDLEIFGRRGGLGDEQLVNAYIDAGDTGSELMGLLF